LKRRPAISALVPSSQRHRHEGIAAQRLAIAEGYHEAMDKLKEAMPETREETILAMLMMTNHWDTIRDAAAGPGNIIMVNGSGEQATQDLARMSAAFQPTGKRPHAA
jgi:hypothetical protein